MHYNQINDQFIADFFKLTDEAKSICITTHISPDEDAIASLLAAYRFLTDKYPAKKVKIISTGERTDRFRSFQHFDKVNFVPDITDHLNDCDLILFLDGGQYHRFTVDPSKVEKFQGKTICIDHHDSAPDKFDLSLIVPTASSTTELIYLSFYAPVGALAKEGKDIPIDKPLAEIFLLGILGDTGTFSHLRPNQTETLLTVKKLIEAGNIEIAELLSRYRTFEPKLLKAIGEFIRNTQYHKIGNWPPFQTSFLNKEFIEENELTDKEISEARAVYVAQYLRKVEGYSWGFALAPKKDGEYRASFRSLPGSVNVRDLAERMGIGGGHDRAAGGSFNRPHGDYDSQACLKEILDWIEENEPAIN